MILLEANQSLLFGGISITDWLQAIGAIIAIIAAIVGFIQLFKDSEDKQKQIKSLTDLAKESKEQTKHLSSQVNEMIKGNELLSNHVNLIQKTVSINEESIIIQREQYDQEKLKRKLDIQPQFTFNMNFTSFYSKQGGKESYGNILRLTFENIGEKATIKEFVKLINNEVEIDFSNYVNKEYLKSKGFYTETNWESQESNYEKYINYKIIYEDVEYHRYYQTFEGALGELIRISIPPIEII